MATVVTITTAGAGSTTVPAGATAAQIECFGCGGSGYGGGGSGGAYSKTNALAVVAGNTLYYNLSSVPAGNNPEANPTDTWVRLTTNAAPTTTAQGCLAKSGVQAHPSDFVGRAGGTAAASVGDVKYNGGAAGNSNASDSGGGGGGGAGSDANGAVGKIVITYNDSAGGLTNLSVKDAGTWKTATPYVKDAGTWKAATEVHVRDAGTWKKVFG